MAGYNVACAAQNATVCLGLRSKLPAVPSLQNPDYRIFTQNRHSVKPLPKN